jgi:hypothetical protein
MNIKGVAWLASFDYILKRFGAAGVEKITAVLSESDRTHLFGSRIMPVSWVDYGAAVRFMVAADKVFGKGDYQIVREAGVYCAWQNFKGIYRFFISLTSPKFILGNSQAVWKQYFDHGKVGVEWIPNQGARLTLTEAPDLPAQHEWDLLPTLEEAVRMSGGKNVRSTHPKCVARADACDIFEIFWE